MPLLRYLYLLTLMAATADAFSVSHHASYTRIAMQPRTTSLPSWKLQTRASILIPKASALTLSMLENDNDAIEEKSTDLDPEIIGLGLLLLSVSAFILINRFVGPWPASIIYAVPSEYWRLFHYLGATVFGGSIILTTCMEWLIVSCNIPSVQKFWFERVPLLDLGIVVPGVVTVLVAGTALTDWRYGSLTEAPKYIEMAGISMILFFLWWALTDLTTQSKAKEYFLEGNENTDKDSNIVQLRKVSNIGSCVFVVVMFWIMTFKPGGL
jgi:hypothetical protein